MPRPKRTQVTLAARAPTPRLATPPRQTLPAQSVLDATTQRDETSSDSDGVVISRRGIKRRSDDDLYMMSGGLGPGEQRPPHATPRTKRLRIELLRVAREADHAEALEGLKRRRAEEEERRRNEAQQGEMTHRNDGEKQNESGESIGDGSELRTAEKGAAADSSMMAIANFKRRPRQPSILRMAQAEQEREKEREKSDEDDLDLDLELGDFKPEDESTPFQVRQEGGDGPPVGAVSPTAHTGAEGGRAGGNGQMERTPVVWGDTMAPPASSSGSERNSRKANNNNGSPLPRTRSTQAKTQPAENRVKKPSQTRKKKTPLTTAVLQDLLPRRRQRGPDQAPEAGNGITTDQRKQEDEFEIFRTSTSVDQSDPIEEHKEQDDDEDAHHKVNRPAASRKQTGGTAQKQRAAQTVTVEATTQLNATTKEQPALQSNVEHTTAVIEDVSTPNSSPLSSLSSSEKENHLSPSAKLAQLTEPQSAITTAQTTNEQATKAFDLGVSPLPKNSGKVPENSNKLSGKGGLKVNGRGTHTTKVGGKIPAGVQKNKKTTKKASVAETTTTTRMILRSGAKEGKGDGNPLAPSTNIAIAHESDVSTEHDEDEIMTDVDDEQKKESAKKRCPTRQAATKGNAPTSTASKTTKKKATGTATIAGGIKKTQKKKGGKTVQNKEDVTGKGPAGELQAEKQEDVSTSTELIGQKKKFREVDRWELCYEDVDTVSS